MPIFMSLYKGQLKQQVCYSFTLLISYIFFIHVFFNQFKMAVHFFQTASSSPSLDRPNAFFPKFNSPWPQLQKARKMSANKVFIVAKQQLDLLHGHFCWGKVSLVLKEEQGFIFSLKIFLWIQIKHIIKLHCLLAEMSFKSLKILISFYRQFLSLTLSAIMEFTIEFDTDMSGWSTVYIEGSQVKIKKKNAFLSLKIDFGLANSAAPDEMTHYAGFHLVLQCLPKYPLMGFPVHKGLRIINTCMPILLMF